MKLIVEVLDASDLMPKDGHGSANPFVEVDFDNQKQKTQTKSKDLNPSWNERLEFQISDPTTLPHQAIDVLVYNDRKGTGHHRNFLGRVRISGHSIPNGEQEAQVQRYPLDKRGLFSHIRGDIALKIYSTHQLKPTQIDSSGKDGSFEPVLGEEKKNKKKKNKGESRVFASIPTGKQNPIPDFGFGKIEQDGFSQMKQTTQKSRPDVHLLPVREDPFGLIETSPAIGGLAYKRDKTSSTYDLVEQMHYLYVSVVKAKDLPAMDIDGSCDPYVEVKLGNYKGTTKTLEKNQNPVWDQVFAFSKERLQASELEVVVKDKDLVKDDFVGKVRFDLNEVPHRVPPDSPLAPQWYRLEDKKGDKISKGELMLGVWVGTQADEAFPNAWHSDAASVAFERLHHTRSKVYFSPKLHYLRVSVIEAQDLVPSDKTRIPALYVKIQFGHQLKRTRPAQSSSPIWNEEFIFVAAEPFEEYLFITVEDRVGPDKDETLAKVILPVSSAVQRLENKPVNPRWFNLDKPSSDLTEGEKKKEVKFSSKIHLRLCLDSGYHVLDESTHYSSDLRPTNKHLWKSGIGILEIGIISARNLVPMKKDGRTTDAYCVAKYGQKWVRTRTDLDTLTPRWNEQYTWDVFDPCTVITIGVFDNCQLTKDESNRDQKIGKVRIRLSTLETDRVYTHYHPLLVLHTSGVKKMGELQLALRFTCTSFVNMMYMYSTPLLPKMHYLQPLPVPYLSQLRRDATLLVAAKLGRAEPPLRDEVITYLLDIDAHMWSLRRSKANFSRIMSLLSGLVVVGRWFDDICHWKNPVTTVLVHVLFFILVCYPELILPTVFLYLFLIGIWNYRFRPRHPPCMDVRLSHAHVHPDELDEEFDSFPTSRPVDIIRRRYDRLRHVAGRVQTVVGDLATQGERAQGILSWRDPRATAIFVFFSLATAIFLYVTPFQVVAVLVGLYMLRHPRFRTKLPSVPFNFYRRLPSKSDSLL